MGSLGVQRTLCQLQLQHGTGEWRMVMERAETGQLEEGLAALVQAQPLAVKGVCNIYL